MLLCHKILAPAGKQPYCLPGTFVTVAAVFVLTAMYTDKLPLSGVIPCFAVPCLFARALRSFKCRVRCCHSLRYSYTLDENRIHQDITMLVIAKAVQSSAVKSENFLKGVGSRSSSQVLPQPASPRALPINMHRSPCPSPQAMRYAP